MNDPKEYVKSRKKVVHDQLDEYGYHFCQRAECGKSRGVFKFEVHHIVFRSERPKHPMLHDPVNLIIVCNKCHGKFHSNKSIRNELVKNRKLDDIFNVPIL